MKPGLRLMAALALAGLVLDRITKQLVMHALQPNMVHPVCPGLSLTFVMNPGAAFSFAANWPATVRLPLFFLFTFIALGAVFYYYKSLPKPDRWSEAALGLVIAGALGNFLDRARFGQVVDFIMVDLGFWPLNPWPIFNVADSCLNVGIVILIWRAFFVKADAPDHL